MSTLYKVFLVIFILFIGLNLYAFNWQLGLLHEENTKFIFSIAAGVLGLLFALVLNTWAKLLAKK